jgi:hypothetical protein
MRTLVMLRTQSTPIKPKTEASMRRGPISSTALAGHGNVDIKRPRTTMETVEWRRGKT